MTLSNSATPRALAVAASLATIACACACDGADPPAHADPQPDFVGGKAEAFPGCDRAQRLRFGMNLDPSHPGGAASVEELQALGVRWVRIEWKWHTSLGGRDAFESYANVIDELRAGGIHVMLLVDYASPDIGKPPSDASAAAWDGYIDTFAARVAEIAAAYGDSVDAWQIWNEQDLRRPGDDYDPGVPVASFGALTNAAAAEIRARSQRPIVSGGFASGIPGEVSEVLAHSGTLDVDLLAVHPYTKRAPDGFPHPGWGTGDMTTLIDGYLAFGFPVVLSEIGTDDRAELTDYVGNVYETMDGEFGDDVPVVFWFAWSDGMVPPFGIHHAGGARKAAADRYAEVSPLWDVCDGIGDGGILTTPPLSPPGGGGSNLPDVAVQRVWATPSEPEPGDAVVFSARVANNGDVVTGDIVGVGFSVDGVQGLGHWAVTEPMAPGAVLDLTMNATWTAGAAGEHTLTAVVDDIDRFPEAAEDNNARSIALSVGSDVAPPTPSADGVCSCIRGPDISNFCHYPRGEGGDPDCGMVEPGGYCDPNGDGSRSDADWVRGWSEYQASCG